MGMDAAWWLAWAAGFASAAAVVLAALCVLTALAGGTSGFAGVGPARPFELRGRDAVVTGGASGIGLEVAKRLVESGAHVHLVDCDGDALERAARALRQCARAQREEAPAEAASGDDEDDAVDDPDPFEAHLCDVAEDQAFAHVLKDAIQISARKRGRHVSILVNNAGIVSGKTWREMTQQDFERTLRVGAVAHFTALKALLPEMVARADGAVVTVSSLMGLLPGAQLADYCTAKHAAVGLHDALRIEIGDAVHFLLVCPYLVDTGMFQGAFAAPNLWFVRALFPPLQLAHVADAMLTALRARQYVLVLPRVLALVPFLVKLLPVRLCEAGLAYMGARDGMKTASIASRPHL